MCWLEVSVVVNWVWMLFWMYEEQGCRDSPKPWFDYILGLEEIISPVLTDHGPGAEQECCDTMLLFDWL